MPDGHRPLPRLARSVIERKNDVAAADVVQRVVAEAFGGGPELLDAEAVAEVLRDAHDGLKAAGLFETRLQVGVALDAFDEVFDGVHDVLSGLGYGVLIGYRMGSPAPGLENLALQKAQRFQFFTAMTFGAFDVLIFLFEVPGSPARPRQVKKRRREFFNELMLR